MSRPAPDPPAPKPPGYPAARAVAGAVEAHFVAARAGLDEAGRAGLPDLPSREAIEEMVDVAFWASLRREEGRSPQISLSYLPPPLAATPLLFERPLPFTPGALTHLAPAVERPGIHLGIWRFDDRLRVWGTTRTVPCYGFVLEVVQPGLLVIKYRRGRGAGKFGNVAVLEGDEIRILDQEGLDHDEYTPTMNSLLEASAQSLWNESANVLVELAVSMRAHRRGGTLLVVPTDSDAWKESIVSPVPYTIAPPLADLANLMQDASTQRDDPRWLADFQRAVAAVAGLTAVDGATVIDDRFDVLAFGAKIGRREGFGPVEEVLVTEPVLHRPRRLVHPSTLGGTRHLSAAQFAHDQRDARALVASQDGRFTSFVWNEADGRVHAHRVEALLL